MKRRVLLSVPAVLGFAALGCVNVFAQPVHRVSAQELQRVLAQRFPARYPIGGLFDLTLETPRLQVLPQANRLGLEMKLEAAGPALRHAHQGSFGVDFALRYEPTDQSIRAHRLRVVSLRLSGLPPHSMQLLDAYAKVLAEQALLEVVLHRLGPRDLALADAMGLQPGEITVTSDGLAIGFTPKPRG